MNNKIVKPKIEDFSKDNGILDVEGYAKEVEKYCDELSQTLTRMSMYLSSNLVDTYEVDSENDGHDNGAIIYNIVERSADEWIERFANNV